MLAAQCKEIWNVSIPAIVCRSSITALVLREHETNPLTKVDCERRPSTSLHSWPCVAKNRCFQKQLPGSRVRFSKNLVIDKSTYYVIRFQSTRYEPTKRAHRPLPL